MTKVQYWDAESLAMKDSWGDYESLTIVHIGETAQATKTVYLHEDSGILVHDVAAFETWLFSVVRP